MPPIFYFKLYLHNIIKHKLLSISLFIINNNINFELCVLALLGSIYKKNHKPLSPHPCDLFNDIYVLFVKLTIHFKIKLYIENRIINHKVKECV